MMVYALIFSVGIEHGYEELIGIYTSEEKLTEAKKNNKDKLSPFGNYYVREFNLDEKLNWDLASW